MQLDTIAASHESPQFTISLTWLRRHATKGAGWSRQQIEALGLPYPPRAGWLHRVAGKKITREQRAAFEAASKAQAGTRSSSRDSASPVTRDDSAELGSYVRAFAALARCDSRTNAFLLWLGDAVERLATGTMSRVERRALVDEAARFVQAVFAATAGQSKGEL